MSANPDPQQTTYEDSSQLPVDVDPNAEEDYNADDSQSDLTSLRSSITDYYFENGRRYHAFHAGAYWGPNDQQAIDHMEIAHYVYNITLRGQLYLAPIPQNLEAVLDVGTGTGNWAIEFADMHPSARVIGTDLSPIQPSFVPPNLQFEVDDCCDPWLFRKDYFDYVHIRGLYGCVADWGAFYKEAYSHIKPGGYIEQLEQSVVPKSDDGTTDGTIFEEWGKVSLSAGDAFGKTLRIVDESRDGLIAAGFVDVVEKRFKVPFGPWAKDPHLKLLGKLNRMHTEEGIEGYTMMLFTKYLGWTLEEVKTFLTRMSEGLHNPSIHSYQEVTVVYGRKPEAQSN